MSLIINPGAGAVPEATEENARTALDMFVGDLREQGHVVTASPVYRALDDGRWEFSIVVDGTAHVIDMPGCAPELTRRGEPWVSPRLYVDGSSWLWGFALSVLEDAA